MQEEVNKKVFLMSMGVGDENYQDMIIDRSQNILIEKKNLLKGIPSIFISDGVVDSYSLLKIMLEELLVERNETVLKDWMAKLGEYSTIDRKMENFTLYLEGIYYLTYRKDPEYKAEILTYSEGELLQIIKQADPKIIEYYNQQNPENKI